MHQMFCVSDVKNKKILKLPKITLDFISELINLTTLLISLSKLVSKPS